MKVAPFSFSKNPARVWEKQKPSGHKANLAEAKELSFEELLKRELGATSVFPKSLGKEKDLESVTHKVLWDLWA